MVQREIADRMAATAGRNYSSFSVLMQLAYSIDRRWVVPRTVFYPIPNVDSVFLLLRRADDADSRAVAAVEPLVRCAFHSRRATMHKNLEHSDRYRARYRQLVDASADDSLICRVRKWRAEQIAAQQFLELARLLGEL